MNMLNSIILEGIMNSVCIRDVSHGKLVCFHIDTLRAHKKADGTKAEEASTFPVECWGNIAERIASEEHLEGRGVRVVGRLKQHRWTDTYGRKHASIAVVAEHVELKGHSQVEG